MSDTALLEYSGDRGSGCGGCAGRCVAGLMPGVNSEEGKDIKTQADLAAEQCLLDVPSSDRPWRSSVRSKGPMRASTSIPEGGSSTPSMAR